MSLSGPGMGELGWGGGNFDCLSRGCPFVCVDLILRCLVRGESACYGKARVDAGYGWGVVVRASENDIDFELRGLPLVYVD